MTTALTGLLDSRLRPLRFIAVGGFTAVVQLGVLAILLANNLSGYVANPLAFLVAAQLNFLLHSGFTWHDRREQGAGWRGFGQRWVTFHACTAGTATVNMVTFFAMTFFVPDLAAAAIGTATSAALNFLTNDRLTFASPDRALVGASALLVAPTHEPRSGVRIQKLRIAHQRSTTIALVVIILLGIALRSTLVVARGQDASYSSMVYANANIASNILRGDGYVSTVSSQATSALAEVEGGPSVRLAPFQEMQRRYPESEPLKVNPQFLPGYPYLVAAIWKIAPGADSYTTVQIVTGTLDGATGALAIWALLAAAGLSRAGVLGAFAYAVQPALIYQSTRFMPDALSALIPILAVAGLVVALRYRRDFFGAGFAGLVLGLGAWMRGDYVAVLVVLIPVIALFVPRSLSHRSALVAVMVVSWIVPATALSAFYADQYGGFHLTRPGAGLLAWEGIGQQVNPWGIEPLPGENLDHVAQRLLNEHGYAYGSWDGDAFLLRETLSHMREEPGWFAEAVARRMLRVAGMRIPAGPTWFVVGLPLAMAPFVLGGCVLLWRRSRIATAAMAALFASRLLPFAVLYDQVRFVILVVPVYSTLMAVFLDWVICRHAPWLDAAFSRLVIPVSPLDGSDVPPPAHSA